MLKENLDFASPAAVVTCQLLVNSYEIEIDSAEN